MGINVEFSDDWFCLYHDNGGVVSDACVEGHAEHMREFAAAIESRKDYAGKRCAIRFTSNGAEVWSPRNSMGRRGRITLSDADGIASQIRSILAAQAIGGTDAD